MNTFGRIFRVSMLGESHGSCVGVLVDGCPAGLVIDSEKMKADLSRRQGGSRPGTTPRRESDDPVIRSGILNGTTTGAPVLILFDNADARSADYDILRTIPRPGHADWTAWHKFGGFNDYRSGGHFSGRLTAAVVAAGAIAKQLLSSVQVEATLISAGGSSDIDAAVAAAMADGDSVGGIVECRVTGVPADLGEPFFDSLESVISHAVFAIPAVKAIEFGDGFAVAAKRGSENNDEIVSVDGATATNHAGGINGGISNGNELVFRIGVKPTSSIRKEKRTVNVETGEAATIAAPGRHDACIALRVPPVLEAMTAIVLTDLMLVAQKLPPVLKAK